jgi:hypothetical protein
MSKLYLTEKGRIISTLGEELTHYRRARKILHLPSTISPVDLFLLARSYPTNKFPLRMSINGKEMPAIMPQGERYLWYTVSVPHKYLNEGENTFEFWNDANAMNAWSLAIEYGHPQPDSFISTDYGQTWQNNFMGHLNVFQGEYLVRVRMKEGEDTLPTMFFSENLNHQRLKMFKSKIPKSVFHARSYMEKIRALATWISSSWEYRHSGDAAQYTPWDPETILAWGKSKKGHDNRLPIVMCVHYGVTMVVACQAIGIHARAAIFTGDINGLFGHFATEVWLPEFKKWVYVDPTVDAVLYDKNLPLSVKDIQQLGNNLQPYTKWGPGYQFQMQNPILQQWIPNVFIRGLWTTHRSIWARADFISNPELTPPGHGSTAYCETDLIWEKKDLSQGFGMFPYFADDRFFNNPPKEEPVEAIER